MVVDRKGAPIWRGVHGFFPAAISGVARVSVAGSRQHHGTDADIHDDRNKSNDDADCLMRHLQDAFIGDGIDRGPNGEDAPVPHIDKVAWRALRLSQKWHEARGAPIAPGARNVAKAAYDATFHGNEAPMPPHLAELLNPDDDEPGSLKAGEAYRKLGEDAE